MRRLSSGGAAVETALLVPFVALLVFSLADIGFLALAQFSLNRACAAAARSLALSPLRAEEELRALAESEAAPATAAVLLRDIPSQLKDPLRDHSLQVIELTLRRRVRPRFTPLPPGGFEIGSSVWEIRVKP